MRLPPDNHHHISPSTGQYGKCSVTVSRKALPDAESALTKASPRIGAAVDRALLVLMIPAASPMTSCSGKVGIVEPMRGGTGSKSKLDELMMMMMIKEQVLELE